MLGNKLSASDLSDYTKDDLQLLINTLYAKNGYIFPTDYSHIQNFYETQYWYNSLDNKTKSKDTVAARIKKIKMENDNLKLLVTERNK